MHPTHRHSGRFSWSVLTITKRTTSGRCPAISPATQFYLKIKQLTSTSEQYFHCQAEAMKQACSTLFALFHTYFWTDSLHPGIGGVGVRASIPDGKCNKLH